MTDIVTRIPAPPGEEEIPVHNRVYSVKSFRIDANSMRLRGRVTDTKPAGLYVPMGNYLGDYLSIDETLSAVGAALSSAG